jgi:vibriolysin
VHRSAEFVKLALPAGAYTLVIKGGAEGTPSNGFSNYSSLGWYALKGTLSAGGTPPTDPVLTSGVPLGNQSASTGNWKYYVIDVPTGRSKITFSINGSNGDADLFAKAGSKPTTSSYACKSDGPTSVETCAINSPTAGRYYVGIYAYAGFSALSVTATIN